MNTTQTHSNAPALPLLRRASTLIAMGTVGLALVAAGPASAEDAKPVTKPKAGTVVRGDAFASQRLGQTPMLRHPS